MQTKCKVLLLPFGYCFEHFQMVNLWYAGWMQNGVYILCNRDHGFQGQPIHRRYIGTISACISHYTNQERRIHGMLSQSSHQGAVSFTSGYWCFIRRKLYCFAAMIMTGYGWTYEQLQCCSKSYQNHDRALLPLVPKAHYFVNSMSTT